MVVRSSRGRFHAARRFAAFGVAMGAATLVAALGLLGMGACTTGGSDPSCIVDIDAGGISWVDGGCSGYPVCAEDPPHPATCCYKFGDAGTAFDNCMFAYGDGVPPKGPSVGDAEAPPP